jgi:hypothetical protein
MYNRVIRLILCSVVFALIMASTATADLVGWWPFDETEGTVATDATGNGYDGEVSGDPLWVEGYIDGALQLDGQNDYVDLGIDQLVPTLEECTLAIWVNYAGGDDWQRIIDIGSSTGNYIYITPQAGAFNDALHVAIVTSETGIWNEFSSDQGTLPIGSWHHVAVGISGSEATMVMYLDGVLVGSMEEMDNKMSDLGETNNSWLGRSEYTADPFLNATLDDFRIYNNVLTESQVHFLVGTNLAQAWKPNPANGATDVYTSATLGWNPGLLDEDTETLYNTHNVYFGTSFDDVNTATEPLAVVVDANEYVPALDYQTTYYWRIDEVGGDEPVKGQVWSFTTAGFIVVDDFESYNDEDNLIYDTWIDGWVNGTGSTVGNLTMPYAEQEIVHSGNQSMPYTYDNFTSPYYSEAQRTWAAPQDWTVSGTDTLTLFFEGNDENSAEPLYVGIEDTAGTLVTAVHSEPAAVQADGWQRWNIPLSTFTDGGVDTTSVSSLFLGVGSRDNPAAGLGGILYIDDVRLYLPSGIEPVNPGMESVVLNYAFSNNANDSSGSGLDATALGVTYVDGPAGHGMAASLDGISDYVELPIGSLISTLTDCSITTWVNWAGGGSWQRIFDFGTGEEVNMYLTAASGQNVPRFGITISGNGDEDQVVPVDALPGGWHHIAVTMDSANGVHSLYVDGALAGQNAEARYTPSSLGETTQNWLGRSQYEADPYLEGALDDFRIYEKVLSEGEALYLATE